MTRETKLLHLRKPAAVGDSIDGWRVFFAASTRPEQLKPVDKL